MLVGDPLPRTVRNNATQCQLATQIEQHLLARNQSLNLSSRAG